MKPKERRDRLFKKSRPNIRPLEIETEEGIGKDMAVLWAAYTHNTFQEMPEGMDQTEFTEYMMGILSPFMYGWIIEDRTSKFKEGHGPVGMMTAFYNGWELEPHYEAFSWASKRNILRSIVSFLQMMRYDKSIGVVVVNSLDKTRNLFKHVTRYGVLRYLDCIPDGDRDGNRHIFYVRGRNERHHKNR